jgi:hypothetical protein
MIVDSIVEPWNSVIRLMRIGPTKITLGSEDLSAGANRNGRILSRRF